MAPLVELALVMTGAESDIVNTTPWLPVLVALVAVTVALNTPSTVGAPEIIPLPALTLNPGGKPDAPKLLGALVAVI